MVEGESGCPEIQVEHGETCRQITAHNLASACVGQELNLCLQSCNYIALLYFFSQTQELRSVFLTGQESLSCPHQGLMENGLDGNDQPVD